MTGATGTLGRAVLSLARGRNVDVRAQVRDASRASAVRALGVEPVVISLFDDDARLSAAVEGSEAVLHLATRIPPINRWREGSAWAENDCIRREGTRNLVRACLAAGIATFIYPSVTVVYPDRRSEWIDAASVPPERAALTESTLDAEGEVERFARDGRRGITLRMGPFYGPQSEQSRYILELARRGCSAFIARDDAYHPFIWIDDAAAAVVAALEEIPGGTYDIVDDEPLTVAEIRRILAEAVGQRRVMRLPTWLLRYSLGDVSAQIGLRSRRVSNAAFKEATGWTPGVPSARVGWPSIAQEIFARSR